MSLGKKWLGVIICLLSVVLVSLAIFIYLEPPGPLREQADLESPASPIKANTDLWDDLANRQQANGSWDNDLETTTIASNALAQSVELMNESEDEIDFDSDSDGLEKVKLRNLDSVDDANSWSVGNYTTDAPTQTQVFMTYNDQIYTRIDVNTANGYSDIAEQTSDLILNTQSTDGSWNDNVQDTSFALYVLKKDETVPPLPIHRGETWLVAQQENDSWGSVLNDSLAVLALDNTSYDTSEVVENIVDAQQPNGSFGDVETTSWAVIALSLYDTPEINEATDSARAWLATQRNLSDRDLALVSLAESEYLASSVLRTQGAPHVTKGKGPPSIFVVLSMIIGGLILLLSVIFMRLGESDALSGLRSAVYDQIKSNPGISQNALKRKLNVSSSSIRHHLKILEKFEFILPFTDGKYIRYYANRNGYSIYTNGNGYKEIISALRKSNAVDIVKFIQNHPRTTQNNLAKALKLHPSTIHWHMKNLLSINLIAVSKNGKSIHYEINGPIDIDKLLILVN